MKFSKLYFLGIVMFTGTITYAQLTASMSSLNPENQHAQKPQGKGFMSKMSISAGAGIATYYGDLTQGADPFSQSSYAFSAGVGYNIMPHLNARIDVSVLKVKAEDSRNPREDLRARNLNFQSVIWDLAGVVEYDMLNLDKFKFTPYVFVGFGAFYFNPYTFDKIGYKQYLRYLGTEGQGLDAYPGRKLYKRIEVQIPFGGGIKWAVSKRLTLQGEFRYRKTNTDYIDDVSRSGYPDKALLDAKNPRTAQLTWRGYEVGGEAYPTNPGLNRGNPKNNDVYYTTQLKVVIKLGKK